MREKNYNAGLRGVLFEARHYERMGSAVWLYGWLILRQTHQSGAVGWVLGGAAISYREIEEETGFNCRTLERWMGILRKHGYVETEAAPGGVIVRITKAKKYSQPPRGFAGGVRRSAWGGPRNCGADRSQNVSHEGFADRIGSSSVEAEIEKTTSTPFRSVQNQMQSQKHDPKKIGRTNNFRQENSPHNPTETSSRDCAHTPDVLPGNPLGKQLWADFAERRRYALLRAEREEAIRRELAVGTGPEVKRS
ncbi:MAG: hypothetical protein ACRD4S_01255 [Candidatus Acidiferrales bacterium]